MPRVSEQLFQLAAKWEETAGAVSSQHYPFRSQLDELLFHAELRFSDYRQYRNEGEFPARLLDWLCNLADDTQQRLLFQVLDRLVFVDANQMRSLYRDAFRRIIAPWVTFGDFSPEDWLAQDYETRLSVRLRSYRFFSITESLSIPDFLHENDLSGLPRPRTLGDIPSEVASRLSRLPASLEGLIILEDFVGSGKQACRILREVRKHVRRSCRVLFVPLLVMQGGLDALRQKLQRVTIDPVVVVPTSACICKDEVEGEPPETKRLRALVRETALRVVRKLDDTDDPPTDAFGYGGLGLVLVTCHNAPNNTLPLIHHRAPTWSPLFRRVHHAGEGM